MKNFLSVLLLIIIGGIFYSLTIRGVQGNPDVYRINESLNQATKPFELSPERGRYLLTYSLVENKSFALSPALGQIAKPDVAYYQNKFYIYFAPGISILASLGYILGKSYGLAQVASFATVSLTAIANLILIFLISRKIFRLPFWASLLSSLIFAFASTSWSYAITLYQHQATTFFVLSAFFAIWHYKKRLKWSWLWGFWIWSSIALSFFVDYPNAVFMMPIIIYFFLSSIHFESTSKVTKLSFRLATIGTVVIFVLIMGIHGYINYKNFGDWKRINGTLPSYAQYQKQQDLLAQQATASANIRNTSALNKLKKAISPIQKNSQTTAITHDFQEDRLVNGFAILSAGNERGLIFFSPIFLLAIFGIIITYKKRIFTIEHNILVSFIALNVVLYSSWTDPWGGWAFGPRYLIPSMAVLAIFVGIYLHETKYKILSKLTAFIFILYSTAIALLGALTTNAVPPKSEADYLSATYHIQTYYNFLLNVHVFQQGTSGSYVFNQYVSHSLNLFSYFCILYAAIILIFVIMLFIVPLFNRYGN